MSDIVPFQKAGRRLRAQPQHDPMVTEIVDALHYLGGQAHRDTVTQCVAAMRRNSGIETPRGLEAQVVEAFHQHLRAPSPGPCLLALPFGPDSRRWGLSTEGETAMQHRMRML